MLDVGRLTNIDYEERLLCCFINRPEALLEADIKEDDFYRPQHQVIYKALLEMYADKRVITPQSILMYFINKKDLLGDVSVVNIALKEAIYLPSYVAEYAKVIHGYGMARKAYQAYREAAYGLFDAEPQEVNDKINDMGQRLMALTQQSSPKEELVAIDETTIVDATDELLGSVVTGLQTPWRDVNKVLTAGLNKGDLVILAGRPSMGKTALSLNFATELIKKDVHVLFFSLETTTKQVMKRILQSEACIRRKQEGLDEEESNRLLTVAGMLDKHKKNLFVCDQGGMTAEQIVAYSRKNKFQHGEIGLIIVDHLQLMQAKGFKSDDRHGVIGHCTAAFKALAKELQCPIIALSQLNRGVESRDNKRPRLSDLKESGSIEQDADLVLMLYRDFPYTRNPVDEYTAELIVAKQKDGATGSVRMMYLPQFMRFQDEPKEWQKDLDEGEKR